MYLIGYITTTHGVKGELKVKNLSDYDRFHVNTQVIINHQIYDIEHIKHQHDHLIITDTGEVKEFCDPRIQSIKQTIEEVFDIKINNHSLYFYGERKSSSKE